MAQNEPGPEAHTEETGQEGARGDDVYQPTNADTANRPTDDLDLENAIEATPLDDMREPGYSPPDRPWAVTRRGTTQSEQREGESLDERLAQEVPDVAPREGNGIGDLPDGEGEPVDPEAGATRAGRLAPIDGSARESRNDILARDVGVDGGAAAAEEAAMHVDTGIEEEAGEESSGRTGPSGEGP
ncbi:hypothetical protein J7E93_30345 [Streptomyces sp. ISL-36]|uniref:DUF5709 domain-containing protein n=1 Tax=Streptomyces sp. ISL-36 TaxID=2819182 RepID=UPI001BE99EA5|nr:DUF5709 domain-containing protein [Streptomyces sp. ISL-36]MBT2444319.1 hypothetical protein [Streptomyces sp. ISL-36]